MACPIAAIITDCTQIR